jgi:hypothetical protein
MPAQCLTAPGAQYDKTSLDMAERWQREDVAGMLKRAVVRKTRMRTLCRRGKRSKVATRLGGRVCDACILCASNGVMGSQATRAVALHPHTSPAGFERGYPTHCRVLRAGAAPRGDRGRRCGTAYAAVFLPAASNVAYARACLRCRSGCPRRRCPSWWPRSTRRCHRGPTARSGRGHAAEWANDASHAHFRDLQRGPEPGLDGALTKRSDEAVGGQGPFLCVCRPAPRAGLCTCWRAQARWRLAAFGGRADSPTARAADAMDDTVLAAERWTTARGRSQRHSNLWYGAE